MRKFNEIKESAEGFLKKSISQKWEEFINKGSAEPDSFKWGDWPLLFEAYAYLGNRNKDFIPEFAKQVAQIWHLWLDAYKKSKLYNYGIFWPFADEYMIDTGDPENAEWVSGNDIECHVAMFRAKEILSIEGFESYFDSAKKYLEDILLRRSTHGRGYSDRYWQILRSSMLRRLLRDSIGFRNLRMSIEGSIERVGPPREFPKNTPDWLKIDAVRLDGEGSEGFFFLVLSGLSDDRKKEAIRYLKELVDEQETNGSFNKNFIKTCLFIASLYLLKLDKHRTILEPAVNWITDRQNNDGSWDHWLLRKSLEYKVLTTVVVLEIIGLVNNDPPLPIWASIDERIDSQAKRPTRIQDVTPLSIPPGADWREISICFTSDLEEDVEIRVGKERFGVKNFIALGFQDRRSGKPDEIWEILKEFARHNGEISWDNLKIRVTPNARLKYKARIKDLRARLKYFFKIDDDPIFPYNRKAKSYVAKFRISSRSTQEE